MASLAFADAHETLDVLFDELGDGRVVVTALEVWDDAFVSCFVDGSGGKFATSGDGYFVFFVAGSVEDFFDVFGTKIANRGMDGEPVTLADGCEAL